MWFARKGSGVCNARMSRAHNVKMGKHSALSYPCDVIMHEARKGKLDRHVEQRGRTTTRGDDRARRGRRSLRGSSDLECELRHLGSPLVTVIDDLLFREETAGLGLGRYTKPGMWG